MIGGLSDLYVFTVCGEDTLRRVMPTDESPDWVHPNLVLAAVRGSGGHRLYYLGGTNPDKGDRPCYEYPREVSRIWRARTKVALEEVNVCDAAAELLASRMVGVISLDEDGKRSIADIAAGGLDGLVC